MKRILSLSFTLLLMFMTLYACSKKEEDNTIKVTKQSISGNWNFSQIVKPDGSIVNYNGQCSSKTDYCEIKYDRITSYFNLTGCQNVNSTIYMCNDYYVNEANGRLFTCNEIYDGTLSFIDANTLRIDYDVEITPSIQELNHAKGFILRRK